MADDLKRVGLVFKQDGAAEFTKSMKEVNAAVKENYSEFRKAKSQWDDNTSSAEKLRTRQKYLADQTQNYTEKTKILRSELDELESAENRDETAISKKRAELNNAESSLNNYKKGLEEVNKELTHGKATLNEYGDKLKDFGGKSENVGKNLTKKVTAPILGVGVAAVKIAADFDQSMSNVRAVAGASEKEFESLREKAIELGADTAFSAKEVADAMTEMAKAGWTSQQILDGMSGVLDAASASGEDLASVATIVADAITGFGLSAKESTRVADLLTEAANAGTIDISDLGESFKYVAPLSRTMGVSIEDVTTALAAMSDSGIKGSQAGTALRGMLSRMIKPTDQVQAAMDALGITISDNHGNFKSLNQIVTELRGKFDGLSDEQKGYYATCIAGQPGQAGMLALLNKTQEEYDGIAESMRNSNGVAKETSEIMRDNLNSDLEELGGNLESSAIKLTENLMPQLRELVKWLSNIVDKFTDLDPKTQDMILKIVGITAVAGPLIIVLGKISNGLGDVFHFTSNLIGLFEEGGALSGGIGFAKSGFKALWGVISGNPIVSVIILIGLLIGALIGLYNRNKEFHDKVNKIYDSMKQGVKDWVDDTERSWDEMTKSVGTQCNQLKNDTVSKIQQTHESIKHWWSETKSDTGNTWSSVTTQVSDACTKLKNHADDAVEGMAVKFSKLPGKITGAIGDLRNSGAKAIQNFIDGFRSINIPTPHFKIIGSFGFNPPSVPHLSVKWNKAGAILNHPTVLPMAANGQFQGMGEDGPEAITPISLLKQYIAEENTKSNAQLVEALKEVLNITIQNDNRTYIGNHEFYKTVSDTVSKRIESKQYGKIGAKGRFAY